MDVLPPSALTSGDGVAISMLDFDLTDLAASVDSALLGDRVAAGLADGILVAFCERRCLLSPVFRLFRRDALSGALSLRTGSSDRTPSLTHSFVDMLASTLALPRLILLGGADLRSRCCVAMCFSAVLSLY